MQVRVLLPAPNKKSTPKRGAFLNLQGISDSNPSKGRCPVGICLSPVSTATTHFVSSPSEKKQQIESCCPHQIRKAPQAGCFSYLQGISDLNPSKSKLRPVARFLQKTNPCLLSPLPQHHIQQHHNRKAKDNAHCGKIRLRLLISLAFRN